MSSRLSATSFAVLTMGLVLATAPRSTLAQLPLEADNTLGNEASTVIPLQPGNVQIGGGAQRGSNLFHSFREFNVNDGGSVYFQNPADIRTIFSRVTGGNASNILGTLGVLGNADLFLLNPSGIIFGENARLDVAGSFFASTANQFQFPDGTSFSAVNPTAPPLLTLSITPGLQYGANPPIGDIANRGNLYAAQNLTLFGNNLDLQGQLWSGGDLTLYARDTLQIRDGVLLPFIAAAQGQLLVQGDRTIDIFALNHPDSGLWSAEDMVLRSPNPVGGDAHYYSGGNFRIEQLDGQVGDLESPNDPIVVSTGNVTIGDYTGASLHILAGGRVSLGNITINGVGTTEDTINPFNSNPLLARLATLGVPVTVNSDERGDGEVDGSSRFFLDVRAGVDWTQLGGFPLPTPTGIIQPGSVPATFGNATNADIQIASFTTDGSNFGGIVWLTNNYFPNTLPSPQGIILGNINTGGADGGGSVTVQSRSGLTLNNSIITSAANLGSSGDVFLQAVGNIRLQPSSAIFSNSINNDLTNGFSEIVLESTGGSVFINQATIQAQNDGTAFAGDIVVDARDRINITNGSLLTANGTSGRIALGTNDIANPSMDPTAPNSILLDSSRITATNAIENGSGVTLNEPAGDVFLRGRSIRMVRSRPDLDVAFITTNTFGTGAGGDVNIRAQTLELRDGSEIVAQTSRAGNAGNIAVHPLDPTSPSTVTIFGIAPFTGLDSDGFPNGGFSSGLISSTEEGATGNGGTITIGSRNPQIGRIGTLFVQNGGVISARTRSLGNGRNIDINVGRLIMRSGGQILTASLLYDPTNPAGNSGSVAGDININATELVSIAGYNGTYNARFDQIQNALLLAGVDPITAFQRTRSTVDTVGPASGLQASDVFGFGQAGSISVRSPRILLSNLAQINATTSGNRDAGNITLQTQRLSVTGGAAINTFATGGYGNPNANGTFGIASGNAGAIFVDSINPNRPSSIFLSGVAPAVLPDRDLAGNPVVNPGGFSSGLLANTERAFTNDDILLTTRGRGGFINIGTVSPFDRLTVTDSAVIATRTRSLGNAGSIRVRVGTLNINRGGQINSASFGPRDAGNVIVNATGQINITGADRTAGDRLLSVAQAYISQSRSQGQDMDEEVAFDNARGSVDVVINQEDTNTFVAPSGIQSQADFEDAEPNSGNISVRGSSINLRDGAEINSERESSTLADFSVVRLVAREGAISLDNSRVSTTNSGTGFAGDIFITSPTQIVVSNESKISSQGNFGRIFLGSDDVSSSSFIPQSIFVSGRSEIETDNGNTERFGGNEQEAGVITFQALNRIDIVGEGTQVSSATFNDAAAGRIFLLSGNTVSIRDGATFFSTIEAGAGANGFVSGGRIRINTNNFELLNGSQLQTLIRGPFNGRPGGRGNAGSIYMEVANEALFDNSAVFSSVALGAEGTGGLIIVGADVTDGEGGLIDLITPTETIVLRNGAQLISATSATSGESIAGDVGIIGNEITLDGISDEGFPSAVFSGVGLGGVGAGGDVFLAGGYINTSGTPIRLPSERITISDAGLVTVSSFGFSQGRVEGLERDAEQQQRAGNVLISADILDMRNERFNLDRERGIFAETGLGGGGNVHIDISEVFLLRGATRISTTAGRFVQPGNGGNIVIRATNPTDEGGYVIAEPFGNNDITADSVIRQGGTVDIAADLVYGLYFRSREDLVDLLDPDEPLDPDRLRTSDVTAISQTDASLNGEIFFNGEITDLTQGLLELPTGVVDAADQIGQVCPTGPRAAERLGNFVVTGRGGVAPSPLEVLDEADITTDWLEGGDRPPTPIDTPNGSSDSSTLIEADGWVIGSNGEVQLVSQVSGSPAIANTLTACPE